MGRIGGAYGVRGQVRVVPVSEDPLALGRHARWWVRRRDNEPWQPCQASGVKAHGGALVATLAGVANREDAERLRGAQVGIARDDLPALAEGEIYWTDLQGLVVINRDGVVLGHVTGMMDNGAHAIVRVQPDAAEGARAERLIPWVPAHVERVDLAGRTIQVDWPADED
ncbi:MAG TPA: ribosome maturation factor RimM [Casimicrobiaceae bacterium]|nr:ribosome maturation factor RimM [Casimicrobiaceae bacterium]